MIQVYVYDIGVLYAHVLMIPFSRRYNEYNNFTLYILCIRFSCSTNLYDSRKCLEYHWGEIFVPRYILTY